MLVTTAILLLTCISCVSAVYVRLGTPNLTSTYIGTPITFNNIYLIIRGPEAIPVNYLNFTVFDIGTHAEIAYVKFNIDGTKITDSPPGHFIVNNMTNTSNLPYQASGAFYGYDEQSDENVTYDHGYGYGSGSTDLTIYYRITYVPTTAGIFRAKLFVDSSIHSYTSGREIFSVFPPVTSSVNPITPYNHSDSCLLTLSVQNETYAYEVDIWYNYSSDNITWTGWQPVLNGTLFSSPWEYIFDDSVDGHGPGYYQFYSIANYNEPTPVIPDAIVYLDSPTGGTPALTGLDAIVNVLGAFIMIVLVLALAETAVIKMLLGFLK